MDDLAFAEAHTIYFVLKDRGMAGPFTRRQLVQEVEAGRFLPTDLAQIEGTPIWQPLRSILEIRVELERPSLGPTPAWPVLLRWFVLRLREDLHPPSAGVAGAALVLGVGALLCARWTFLFWLPWFLFALTISILLFRAERFVAASGLLLAVVALPLLLLPHFELPLPLAFASVRKVEAPALPVPDLSAKPARPALSGERPMPDASSQAISALPIEPAAPEPTLPDASQPAPLLTPAPLSPLPSPPMERSSLATLPAGLPSPGLPSLAPGPMPTPPAPTPAPPVRPGSSGAEFVQKYSSALVLVKDAQGSGSGFIARTKGKTFLFTNIHVAAAMKSPQFTLLDGSRLTPLSMEAAVGHDIIRFVLKEPPRQAMDTAESLAEAHIADDVAVLGNSGGGGVITHLAGKLVGLGPDRIEVSAEFIPGNSGSPVLHLPDGQVIGIATYLTKRYDDFAGPATSHGGVASPVVRRFAYRLDSVGKWEPVNWAVFQADADQLQRISRLTGDVFDFLKALHEKRTPDFATDTLRRPASDWLNKIKGAHHALADRRSATQGFLNSLRSLARADIAQAENSMHYSYFRDELRQEKEIRDRLCKNFDDQAQELAAPAMHAY